MQIGVCSLVPFSSKLVRKIHAQCIRGKSIFECFNTPITHEYTINDQCCICLANIFHEQQPTHCSRIISDRTVWMNPNSSLKWLTRVYWCGNLSSSSIPRNINFLSKCWIQCEDFISLLLLYYGHSKIWIFEYSILKCSTSPAELNACYASSPHPILYAKHDDCLICSIGKQSQLFSVLMQCATLNDHKCEMHAHKKIDHILYDENMIFSIVWEYGLRSVSADEKRLKSKTSTVCKTHSEFGIHKLWRYLFGIWNRSHNVGHIFYCFHSLFRWESEKKNRNNNNSSCVCDAFLPFESELLFFCHWTNNHFTNIKSVFHVFPYIRNDYTRRHTYSIRIYKSELSLVSLPIFAHSSFLHLISKVIN